MMPPSDSDSDDESEDGVSGHTNGQSKNAGMMPPSDSDDESDDEVAPLPKGKPFFSLLGELNPEIWQKRGPTYGRNGSFLPRSRSERSSSPT